MGLVRSKLESRAFQLAINAGDVTQTLQISERAGAYRSSEESQG